MEQLPKPENEGSAPEMASWVEKIKKIQSKMPWVKSSEGVASEQEAKQSKPPELKGTKLLIEPKDEKLRDYLNRRLKDKQDERITKAKADLVKKIALYEKHKDSMNDWERKLHEDVIREHEAAIRLMER